MNGESRNGESRLESQCLRQWKPLIRRQSAAGERRRTERSRVCLAFDVHERGRFLGRYWSRNASQTGLFLNADPAGHLRDTILSLRFQAHGVEHWLRGTVVHAVPGQGVGIALAFWRLADRNAHAAYRLLLESERPLALG